MSVTKRVIGVYFENGGESAGEVCVLVLDDGTGIAFGGNGSHWTVSADDVARRAASRREELQQAQADLEEVLRLEAVLKP